nr:hypothetical protein Iba_chr04aCG0470 [Ipomoea batatas]
MALDMEIIPTKAAEKEMMGLTWPPETGSKANIIIVAKMAISIDMIKFGVLVSVSYVEITTLVSMEIHSHPKKQSPSSPASAPANKLVYRPFQSIHLLHSTLLLHHHPCCIFYRNGFGFLHHQENALNSPPFSDVFGDKSGLI